MKELVLALFKIDKLLDKDCLKQGTKHIQLEKSVKINKYYRVDALYIGDDGELRFLLSDIKTGAWVMPKKYSFFTRFEIQEILIQIIKTL